MDPGFTDIEVDTEPTCDDDNVVLIRFMTVGAIVMTELRLIPLEAADLHSALSDALKEIGFEYDKEG